jgi:7-carboxy-7-deazaguanine synthase
MLFYTDVFASIQGEGYDTGFPCVFVRLFGCNLNCAYCDTIQTKAEKKRAVSDKLIEMVRKFRINRVCITGGEPLLQPEVYELIYGLTALNYLVSVETNGAVPISPDYYNRSYKYVMDIKTPSSKMESRNFYGNLESLHYNDELKFVIADRVDYNFAKEVLSHYPTKARVLFSPMFDSEGKCPIAPELTKWLLEDKFNSCKIQIQLHKIIGVK